MQLDHGVNLVRAVHSSLYKRSFSISKKKILVFQPFHRQSSALQLKAIHVSLIVIGMTDQEDYGYRII
uniref:Uncharacterized protein n=1 Tax=Arundo donax TaxID=35708 RepID=A0A0A9BPG5_ARUDO